MIAWIMTLFAEVVFDSASGSQRAYTTDFARYLRSRGFKPRHPTTREVV